MGSFGSIENKLSILVPKIPTVNSDFCRSLESGQRSIAESVSAGPLRRGKEFVAITAHDIPINGTDVKKARGAQRFGAVGRGSIHDCR